jgi:nucleotide-binding universal stress UspA family protein
LIPAAGSRVTVVSVVEPVRAPSMPLMPAAVRQRLAAEAATLEQSQVAGARRHVESAARDLSGAGWRTRVRVERGVPIPEILRAVATERADLLVLGARGVTGLERLLLGSVAEGALKRCSVAVLIVR